MGITLIAVATTNLVYGGKYQSSNESLDDSYVDQGWVMRGTDSLSAWQLRNAPWAGAHGWSMAGNWMQGLARTRPARADRSIIGQQWTFPGMPFTNRSTPQLQFDCNESCKANCSYNENSNSQGLNSGARVGTMRGRGSLFRVVFSRPPDAHGIKAACGVEPLRLGTKSREATSGAEQLHTPWRKQLPQLNSKHTKQSPRKKPTRTEPTNSRHSHSLKLSCSTEPGKGPDSSCMSPKTVN